MQFASVAIISVSFDDRFPQVGIQVTMIKTYNPDKTLIESTSETPYYPLMGGGGGDLIQVFICSRDHGTILAHWIQLSQLYHQPN